MKAEDLKNSILQLAMEGKLVPQDPNDEPASVLLERIKEEKEKLIKEKKIRRNNKESFIFRKNGHFYEKVGKKGEPCIDDEIPFEVPKNWELCRLSSLGISTSGKTPKAKELHSNGKYPYFKVGDMNTLGNELYLNVTENYLSKDYSSKLFAPNSIVYPKNGGAVFTNKRRILKYESVVDLNTGVFSPYSCLDLMYVYMFFQSIDFKKYHKGTALPTIDKKRIDNILIGLPPFNEQKRIVNKIKEISPLIQEYGINKEKLDKLNSEFPNQLKSSILQEAIQGKLIPQDPNDEPASVLLERIKDEKERLIKEKKIKRNKNESYIFKENNHFYEKTGNEVIDITNELPFDISDNWAWSKLENITSNIHYGYTASAQEVGNVKLLRITDIHENNVNWDSVPYCVINEDKLSNYILNNRDIVMARTGGTIGKSYIINNLNLKAVFASYLIRIIPLKHINENYLKHFFESPLFWNQLKKNTKGTGQPNVNAKSLKSLLIPLPPFIEQEKIVNKIEKIFNEINLRLKV